MAANRSLKLQVLDVRGERDYNLFTSWTRGEPVGGTCPGSLTKKPLDEPPNAVIVLGSNDEVGATEGVEGVPDRRGDHERVVPGRGDRRMVGRLRREGAVRGAGRWGQGLEKRKP